MGREFQGLAVQGKRLLTDILVTSSPRDSPRQSAIAKGFAEANSVFIVITSAKILPK